jgi:sterol desaturase/sphingolipid hydroxylase (fatty acid hydroxylase superfamily)
LQKKDLNYHKFKMAVNTTTVVGSKPVGPNPRDSMKSTWRTDKSQWGFWHWLYEILNVHPTNLNQDVPVHSKTDPVPHRSSWQMHRWVLVHASIPLIIHQAFVYFTGKNLSAIGAFFLYTLFFKLSAIHHLYALRWLGHTYGFFDGDVHGRDEVPDTSVGKVIRSLMSTSTVRPMMSTFLAYSARQAPASISLYWLPLEIGLYGIVLDFWFYWYHRFMHDNDGLWQYHRRHHLTKHPNPLLTLYADSEQEIFDIAIIPLLTWCSLKLMGLPMGFYDWWVCHQYVVFAELEGHSGLRLHATPPNTFSWLLEVFNCELVIEDHDLHHRKGWKKSHNYGKQTRLWDRIFGTCHDRIETLESNVDYENPVPMPFFFDSSKPPTQPVRKTL